MVKLRRILVLLAVTAGLFGAGWWVYANVNLLPTLASTRSVLVDRLFRFLLGTATVVFLLVEGLLVYAVLRFRRKPGDGGEGRPIHGNTPLEIVWTLVPAVIVVVIAVYSFQVLTRSELAADDPLVVEVIGRQFAWEFHYPEAGLSSQELHLPVGQPVRFEITSEDVIHSFWVPNFLAKRDATPGQISTLVMTPNEEGIFPVRCAELCGAGHATMVTQVVVETEAAFQGWIISQTSLPADPIEAGRVLFARYGCSGCHALADAGAKGVVGPALDGLAAPGNAPAFRQGMELGAYVKESILKPSAIVVPGFPDGLMPKDFGQRIPANELAILVGYLEEQQ